MNKKQVEAFCNVVMNWLVGAGYIIDEDERPDITLDDITEDVSEYMWDTFFKDES